MIRPLACLALLLLSLAPAMGTLNSAPSFAAAQARAKKEKRLVFLMFKSADCKHCRQFSEKVLSTEIFQNFARDYLAPIIYDVDAYAALPEAERALAMGMEAKYGVEKMPAIVVFAPDGKELMRTQGYRGTAADVIVSQLRGMVPK